MRITRLYLRNYRVYEDELDLELPGGLVGIFGPNGAGKSTLLESILWTLFGKARTTKDEIRTAGTNGDCTTEVEFEHEGHLYLVRRSITGVGATVKCEVHADRAQMAEGVLDSKRYIQSVLGMDDTAFRASVFAEQNHLAAFSTDVTPERRKKLVLSLLGITPLESARDLARKDARDATERHERVRAMLADLDELEARAAQAASQAGEAAAEAEKEAAVGTRAREALVSAEAAVERMDDLRREYDRLIGEGKAARREADQTKTAIAELEAELSQLTEAAAQLETLRADADGLDAIEQRLPLVEAVEKARAVVDAIVIPDEVGLPDERTAQEAADALATAREALGKAEGELVGANADLERAEAAWERAGDLSGEAECPTCGQALGAAFEQVQAHRKAEHAEARERQRAAAKVVKERRASVDAASAHATRVIEEMRAAQKARAEWERVRDRRGEAEHALTAALATLDPEPVTGEAKTLRIEVSRRRAARDECQKLEGRLQRRAVAEAALAEHRERHREAEETRLNLLDKVKALAFDPREFEVARQTRDQARALLEKATAAAQQAALLAERTKSEAAASAQRLADAKEQHAQIASLGEDARHLERVASLLQAFRTNVITAVGPRLSAQAAELFGELTDHEYDTLDVDPETYEIRISDEGRSYGISRFSGSETDLANLALRVAISEQVRFQSGGAVGLLVLDEVFGPLDDDRKARMLLALERLRARFRQVLVVTHASEIKEQLPSAVEVVKLPGRRATARVLAG